MIENSSIKLGRTIPMNRTRLKITAKYKILENKFSSQTTLKFKKKTRLRFPLISIEVFGFNVRDNALLYIIHLKKYCEHKKLF